jgi:hypothetical protein
VSGQSAVQHRTDESSTLLEYRLTDRLLTQLSNYRAIFGKQRYSVSIVISSKLLPSQATDNTQLNLLTLGSKD